MAPGPSTTPLHPEYTFVNAAERLTNYIDTHPNGNRLLVSISGDQIALITHLPALCDDFGTPTPQCRIWSRSWTIISRAGTPPGTT